MQATDVIKIVYDKWINYDIIRRHTCCNGVILPSSGHTCVLHLLQSLSCIIGVDLLYNT